MFLPVPGLPETRILRHFGQMSIESVQKACIFSTFSMYENEHVQIYVLFCMSKVEFRQKDVKYESGEGPEREGTRELRGEWLALGAS